MPAAPGKAGSVGCTRSLLIAGLILAGLALLVCFTPLSLFVVIPAGQHWYSWRNRTEFDRHRERYEEIVRVLEAETGLPLNRVVTYSLGPDRDPASLRALSPAESEAEEYALARASRIVSARRTGDGRLLITIRTYDYGHAGAYGLVYSSGPPLPWELSNAFGGGGIVTPVSPNWWAVEDYTQ